MSWFRSSKQPTDPSTSSSGSYKPMKRTERQQCWEARDTFFSCLDRNNVLDSVKEGKLVEEKCGKEHRAFEQNCASSWVTYFKQKRVADFEKAQKIKKLEAEGAIPIQQAQANSSWKFW